LRDALIAWLALTFRLIALSGLAVCRA